MSENKVFNENTVAEERDSSIPFFKILLKNGVLIVLVTVLCALIGLGYGVIKVKPTYTASRSVIFRTDMNDTASNINVITNQASLAKIYLPVISSVIKSPAIIEKANEVYNAQEEKQTKVTSAGVGVSYKENSLIFTMSYTDKDETLSKEKLEAVISAAQTELGKYVQASDVTLIDVQNDSNCSINYAYGRYVGIGAGVGLIGIVLIVLLIYVLDNTVKNKQEFEELTGLNVIAYIEKDKRK